MLDIRMSRFQNLVSNPWFCPHPPKTIVFISISIFHRGAHVPWKPLGNARRNRIPNRGERTHPLLLGGGSEYNSGQGFPTFLNPTTMNGGGIHPLQKGFPRLREPFLFSRKKNMCRSDGVPSHNATPSLLVEAESRYRPKKCLNAMTWKLA